MQTPTLDTAPAAPSQQTALTSMAARHPLLLFFLFAYGFSWLVELILFGLLHLPAAVVVPCITVGPTFAAVTMTALVEGRPGLARLRARMRMWRVGARWYAVALLLIPAAYLLGTLVYPGALASFTAVPAARWIVEYVIVFTLGGIIGGPLFEEPGWRGFALPRMQGRLGPLGASLGLGVILGRLAFPAVPHARMGHPERGFRRCDHRHLRPDRGLDLCGHDVGLQPDWWQPVPGDPRALEREHFTGDDQPVLSGRG